jgi:hypothetical protein
MSTLDAANCGKGMVFTVNPPPERNLVLFKTNALKSGSPSLKNAQIVASQPVQQLASTISIAPQGNGNAKATPGAPAAGAAPSVIAGQGMTGAGQACGCMCLCGAGSFPANAGQGAFGGTLGMLLSYANLEGRCTNTCDRSYARWCSSRWWNDGSHGRSTGRLTSTSSTSGTARPATTADGDPEPRDYPDNPGTTAGGSAWSSTARPSSSRLSSSTASCSQREGEKVTVEGSNAL